MIDDRSGYSAAIFVPLQCRSARDFESRAVFLRPGSKIAE